MRPALWPGPICTGADAVLRPSVTAVIAAFTVPSPALKIVTSLVLGRHTLISFLEALQQVTLSDIQAKGGRSRHALALVTVPDEGGARSGETLFQVLAGIRSVLDPLGVSLVGGHSTLGPELFVGLSITGDLPEGAHLVGLDGLRDQLPCALPQQICERVG